MVRTSCTSYRNVISTRRIPNSLLWSSRFDFLSNREVNLPPQQVFQRRRSPPSFGAYLGLPLISIFLGVVGKLLTRKIVASGVAKNAWAKFHNANGWLGIYGTIPLIAGIVNMATNKLAVWMIFNPVKFMGWELKKREEGQPFGLLGWQGIVPSKVKKMGNDICDILLLKLLKVKDIFQRLDSDILANILSEKLSPTIIKSVTSAISSSQGGGKSGMAANLLSFATSKSFAQDIIQSKIIQILKRIIEAVKMDPEKYINIRSMVLGDLVQDPKLICDLFQKCGRDELRFIVSTGLYGGFFLGVIQMMVWLVFDPWWSLALGGALVGYITDWIALKVMFEPVEPVYPLQAFNNDKFMIQGLFLQRQKEVSAEFATFVASNLLTPSKLWNELSKTKNLNNLIASELRNELGWFLTDITDHQWSLVASQIQTAIPAAAVNAHKYTEKALELEKTIELAMNKLSTQDFERVLHPVFQEDETTLILVGTALGAAAGFAQVPFY